MTTTTAPSPGNSIISRINHFLNTPGYISVIMLLTLLSNMFGLELWVYSTFIVIAVYLCIFGDDLLPLMPIVVCCYIAPSKNNNPGRNQDSIFLGQNGGVLLICLAAVAVIALLYRMIRDRKQFFSPKRRLLPGMLILAAAYLAGGIGSSGYTENAPKSILFAAANAAALILPYLLFSDGFSRPGTRKDYLAWTGIGIGCVLLCEIAFIFLTGNVIQAGAIHRKAIFTGWGMYNNIGSLLAMMIPFPFYLATKHRRGWLGTLAGSLFLVGVLFTCSRASILCGCGIYFLCVVLMLYYTGNPRANALALLMFMGGLFVVLLVFSRPLMDLFEPLLDHGLDPSNRDSIYRDGIRLFLKYPVFGGSFFSSEYAPWGWSTVEALNDFLPPRWHNTIVQLLASCGVVGLTAYSLHRLQTVFLFLRERKPEKIFACASLVVLLACSMFDCHFFNIGPVLFYSSVLAFAEHN